MNDRFVVRAYWGPRKETVDDCSNRLERFLTRISAQSDLFVSWYEKVRNRGKATSRSVSTSRDGLLELLRSGQNCEDTTGEVIEDLGFRVSLWNGGRGSEVSSLSIRCGVYCSVAGVGLNCVLFDLPEQLGSLASGNAMVELFCDVVESWEPQRAAVCSELALDKRSFDANHPFVDWMVYVAGLKVAQSDVPVAAAVRHVETGTMIVVEDYPGDALRRSTLQRLNRWRVPSVAPVHRKRRPRAIHSDVIRR